MASNPEITIRGVKLQDVPAISAVHRGSEGPWADPVGCAIFVNHRLLRPFHCYVAEHPGQVVGHAEWIVGREPDLPEPQLYLGMLQVREDFQGQGVGRRLIEHGSKLALQEGCGSVRTVPEEGVEGFYARCGFKTAGATVSCRVQVGDCAAPQGWKRGRVVPERVPRALPMRFGWVQACSTHMWEICNRPAELAGNAFFHPCLMRRDGQAYVQLRFSDSLQAVVLAWSRPEVSFEELLTAAHHLGSSYSISCFLLAFRQEEVGSQPNDTEPGDEIPILERPVQK